MDQSAPRAVASAATGPASAIAHRRYRPDEIRADRCVHVVGVVAGGLGALGMPAGGGPALLPPAPPRPRPLDGPGRDLVGPPAGCMWGAWLLAVGARSPC